MSEEEDKGSSSSALLVEGIEDYLIAHPVDYQVGCDASVLIAHPVDHQEVWHHKERRRADIEYL